MIVHISSGDPSLSLPRFARRDGPEEGPGAGGVYLWPPLRVPTYSTLLAAEPLSKYVKVLLTALAHLPLIRACSVVIAGREAGTRVTGREIRAGAAAAGGGVAVPVPDGSRYWICGCPEGSQPVYWTGRPIVLELAAVFLSSNGLLTEEVELIPPSRW